MLSSQLWGYFSEIPKVALAGQLHSDSGQSKVKPSQVNIEPGVKTPPDTIHK